MAGFPEGEMGPLRGKAGQYGQGDAVFVVRPVWTQLKRSAICLLVFVMAVASFALASTTSASAAVTAHKVLPATKAPSNVEALRESGGTHVAWIAPEASSMKGHLLGFEVAVCGPYAIGSKSFSTALSIQCAGDPHVSVKRVAATTTSIDMPCDASPTTFCIAVVNALTTKGVSSSAVAGAGGLPPRAVTHLVDQATPSGTGIALGWAPGTQVKQPAGVPSETLRYSVLRNGHVIARAISGLRYVDNGCGAGETCRESVEALTPGGASAPMSVSATTGGTQAPSLNAASTLLQPGVGTIAGQLGNGANDQRPVAITLTPVDGTTGAIRHVVAQRNGDAWSLTIPRDLSPGAYGVTATQGWFSSPQSTIRVAHFTPLSASSNVETQTASGNGPVSVSGEATPSPAASTVGVSDSWTTASATAPSTSDSSQQFVSVAANGTWSMALPANAIPGLHHLVITQSVPGHGIETASLNLTVAASALAATATKPSAPPSVTATAGNASAKVVWTTPSAGTSPITSYKVTASPGTASCTYTVPTSNPTNTCTVTGLTNATTYQISVTATSAAGTSPAATTTVTPAGPPSAPAAPSVLVQSGQAQLAWSPAPSNGSPITSYIATASPGGQSCTSTVTAGTPEVDGCTVTNLTNGTAYTFSVVAVNAVGKSAASPASKSATPLGPPAAPTAVTTSVTGTSVKLSWTAPSATGGSPVTSYTATSTSGGLTCRATTTTCSISSLRYGQAYSFSVTATNAVGTSVASTGSTPFTLSSAPGAPVSVVAAAHTASAVVSWLPGPSNGANITTYKVSTVSGSQSCTYTVPTSSAETDSCTVTGLTNGHSYQFVVAATNVKGSSVASSSSAAVTPIDVPSAPSAVSANLSGTSVTVTWNPSTQNGGSTITGYTATLSPGGLSCSSSLTGNNVPSTSCQITGLTVGTTYTSSVVATNAAGNSVASQPSSSFVVSQAPSAPQNLTAVAGNQSVTFTWQAPLSTNGAAVTNYTVSVTNAQGVSVGSCSTTSLSCQVFNLTNGVTYSASVTATNRSGTSPALSVPNIAQPLGVPTPPSAIAASPGIAQAVVSWQAPQTNGGSPVLSYLVTATPGNETCSYVVPTDGSPETDQCTVLGLTIGTTYTFSVVATNAQGSSPTSGLVATGTPGAVPSAPTSVIASLPASVVASTASATVNVQWQASAVATALVASYTATASPGGQSCTVMASFLGQAGTPISCVIGGLTTGVTYTFSVVANGPTSDLSSAASAPSNAVMPIGRPSAPTIGTITVGVGSATVSATAGASNGSVIQGLLVSAYLNGVDANQHCSISPTASLQACTVTGLTAGASYSFSVVAVNVVGYSPAATTTQAVMIPAAPSAPTNVAVGGANNSVTVSWVPGSTGGLAVTSYRVSAYSENTGTTLTPCIYSVPTQSPETDQCTFTGLTNGYPYDFTVTAANAAGTSPPSASVTGRPGPPPSVASVVAAFTVGQAIHVLLNVWTPGESNATPETATVTASPGGQTCTQTGTEASISECDFTNLANNTTYSFTVAVTNSYGSYSATWSGSVGLYYTPPPPAPDPPQSPQVRNTTGGGASTGTALVTWLPPDNASQINITDYLVTASTGQLCMAYPVSNTSPLSALQCTLYGIPLGSTVTATVQTQVDSINGNKSDPSVTSNAVVIGTTASPPTNVVATAQPGGATVTWSDPTSNGGAPITSYVVTPLIASVGTVYNWDNDPVPGWKYTIDQNVTPCVVTVPASGAAPTESCSFGNLTLGDSYVFQVSAVNAAGSSGFPNVVNSIGVPQIWPSPDYPVAWELQGQSNFVNITTGPPGAPTGVSAVLTGANFVDLYWNAPAITGGDTLGAYRVQVFDATTGTETSNFINGPSYNADGTMAQGSTSSTIHDLTVGDSYYFKVSAITYDNLGNTLEGPTATSGIVGFALPPQAPTNVVATAGAGGVSVSWTPTPASSNGGSPVTSYTVESASVVSGASTPTCTYQVPTDGSAETDTCIVTGLSIDKPYTFVVIATSIMSSNLSDPSSTVLAAQAPPQVSLAWATASDTSATVHWSSVTDLADLTQSYTVTASPGGAQCLYNVPTDGSNETDTCTFTGLTNGMSYTFTVTAHNAIGDGPMSNPTLPIIPVGTPSPPTTVIAVAADSSATLSWVPGSGNGAQVTRYTATALPGGAQCIYTVPNTGPETDTCRVVGLTNGTAYSFSVTQTTSAGTSASSPPSTTVTPVGTPFAPQTPTLSAGLSGVSVSWSPSNANGSPIVSYTTTASPGGQNCSYTVPTDGSTETDQCLLTGLTPGQRYAVSLVATNAQGVSSPSSSSATVTTVTTPSAPSNVVVTASNTSATVSWTPGSANGTPILGFVASTSSGSQCGVTEPGDGTTPSLSCVLTNLTNGQSYSVSVVAINGAGNSSPSTSVSVTPGTIPDSPQSLSLVPADSSVTASWTPPSSNGGAAVTSYLVSVFPGGKTCSYNVPTNGAPEQDTCTVRGLSNGTSYSAQVVAVNTFGDSSVGIAPPVVPAGMPATPAAPSLQGADGSALATWSPSSGNGAPILSYTVSAYSAAAWNNGAYNRPGFLSNPDAQCSPTPANATTCALTGLSNGQSEIAVVTATTAIGTSSMSAISNAVTPAGLMPAPTAVSAMMNSNGTSALVNFTPAAYPLNGNGSAVTSYVVTSVEDPSKTCTDTINPASGGVQYLCTISNLVAGNSYTFTVAAVNGVGKGAQSAPSAPVYAGGVPAAPTAVSTTVVSPTSVKVSWTPPTTKGWAPLSYWVSASPGGAWCTYQVPASGSAANSCTLTGLQTGTGYSVTVAAINIVGWGPTSVASTVVPSTVPMAPSSLTSQVYGTSLQMTWTAPPSNGGATISSYAVTLSPGGASCTATSSLSCTISNLTAGQTYTPSVVATNSNGSSLATVGSATLLASNPSAPSNVVATPQYQSAMVTWSVPQANGSLILYYTVTASPGGATCTALPTKSGNVSCGVLGLTNGTPYSFNVKATNLVGTSTPSSASVPVTPGAVPTAPNHVAASSQVGSVTVSWWASNSNGYSITNYSVSALGVNGVGCSTTGATSCTVTGLSPGESFSYVVSATNALGVSTTSAPTDSVAPFNVPSSPVPTLLSVASHSATLMVSANASDSPITSYQMFAVGNPSAACTVPASASNLQCTITGLTNGVHYQFVATATSAAGISLVSAPTATGIPAAAPLTPIAPTAVVGNATVTVSWVAPLSDGTPITGYQVTSSPAGATCTTTGVTSCVIGSLTPKVAYSFSVVATNVMGSSSASPFSSPVMTDVVPAAPTVVMGTIASTTSTVSWVPGNSTGSPTTSYQVSVFDVSGSTLSADTSTGVQGCTYLVPSNGPELDTCTVTGLTNAKTYAFEVTALNAVGASAVSSPSASVIPASVPTMGTPSATVNLTTATISWSPANGNGSAVTNYLVTASPGGLTCSTAGTRCTIGGLNAGTTYSFSVVATNAQGSSAASSPSNVVLAVAAPNAPTTVTASPGNTSIAVSWMPSVINGAPVTSYTVSVQELPSATCTYTPPSSGPEQDQCIISGLTNGTTYHPVVVANSAAGSSTPAVGASVTPASVPSEDSAPTAVIADAQGDAATVTWTAASAHGAAVSSYLVTSFPGGLTCSTTGTLSCMVSNLVAGTSYTFSVVATNAQGSSVPSASSNAVSAGQVPNAPVSPMAVAGNTTATVSWSPPTGNGTPVLSYSVSASPGGATCSYQVPQSGPELDQCTVTGLTNAKSYTFSVIARDLVGSSSAANSAAVVPGTPPAAPTNLSITPGNATATVTWVASVPNSTPVISYTASVVGSPSLSCTAQGAAATSCVITGLTNASKYQFQVVAANVFANSTAATSTSTTIGIVPGPVSQVQATASNTAATITWQAADGSGLPVTSYKVTASSPTTSTTASCSTATTSCTISGLTNGVSYSFAVAALNSIGTGSAVSSNPIIPAGVPTTPVIASLTAGQAKTVVAWTPTSGNGSSVTSYQVTATAAGVTKTCSATTTTFCAVTGLTNGTTYSFTLTATNAVGTSSASAAMTAMPVAPPNAPTGITLTPGAGSVTVAWTAPSTNGSPITGYTASVTPGATVNSYTCTTTSATATSCTLTGLPLGVSVPISVVANSAAGASPASAVVSGTGFGLPAAPVLSVTPGYSSITASVHLPPSTSTPDGYADGGSMPTSYTVTTSTGVSCTTSTIASDTSASCTIAGLTNGTTYVVSALATNIVGTGFPSAPAVITAAAAPSAPTSIVLYPGSTEVTVLWSPAASNGAAITSYTATEVNSGQSCTAGEVASHVEIDQCTITGLTDGASDSVVVSATNKVGSTPSVATAAFSTAVPSPSVTGLSGTGVSSPASSISLSAAPVLNGTAVSPLLPSVGATVTVSLVPVGSPTWFPGSSQTPSFSATVSVSNQGAWSVTLPSYLASGTYSASVTQSTPWGSLSGSQSVTLTSAALIGTAVHQALTSGGENLVVTGSLPGATKVTALSLTTGSGTSCTATISGSTFSCTLHATSFTAGALSLTANETTTVSYQAFSVVGGATQTINKTATQTQTVSTSVTVAGLAQPEITSPQPASFTSAGALSSASLALVSPLAVSGSLDSNFPGFTAVALDVFAGNTTQGSPVQVLNPTASLSTGFASTLAIGDGTWTVVAVASDAQGDQALSAPVTFVTMSTPPSLSLTWPNPGATISSAGVGGVIANGWSASSALQASFKISYYHGSSATGTASLVDTLLTCASCNGQFLDTPNLAAGTWTAVVATASANGVTATKTVTFSVSSTAVAAATPIITLTNASGVALANASSPVAGANPITVSVQGAAGSADAPLANGSVTLFDGVRQVGSATLVQGQATIAFPLSVTSQAHLITASYMPSPSEKNFIASTSLSVSLTPVLATPAVTLNASFPAGESAPGSLSIGLSYTGTDGTTQYCDNPTVTVEAATPAQPQGGIWLWNGTRWQFNPGPTDTSYAGAPKLGQLVNGTLVTPMTQGNPSGPGTIATPATTLFSPVVSSYVLWVSSSGDDRCGSFSPVAEPVTISPTQYAAFAQPATPITHGQSLGTSAPYVQGQATTASISVLSQPTWNWNVLYQSQSSVDNLQALLARNDADQSPDLLAGAEAYWAQLDMNGSAEPWSVGVPVYPVNPDGSLGTPVYTNSQGVAQVPWTPAASGWVTQRFQVGSKSINGAFTGTTTSITVPVEPQAVSLSLGQTPNSFQIGQAGVVSTLSIGTQAQGQVQIRDHSVSATGSPGPWTAGTLNCPSVTTATCTATFAMPSSLVSETPVESQGSVSVNPLEIDGQYTSATTGLVYNLTSPITRAAPQPTTTTVQLSNSPTLQEGELPPTTESMEWQPLSLPGANSVVYTAKAMAWNSTDNQVEPVTGLSCTPPAGGSSCQITGLNPSQVYVFAVFYSFIDAAGVSHNNIRLDDNAVIAVAGQSLVANTGISTDSGSVPRDSVENFHVTVSGPQLQTLMSNPGSGMVQITATPKDCSGAAYCTAAVTQINVDTSTLQATVIHQEVADSLPLVTTASWTSPTTLAIDSQAFIGGMAFNVTAQFIPSTTGSSGSGNLWSPVQGSSSSTIVTGVGPAPISMEMGSATVSGGFCQPGDFTQVTAGAGPCEFTNVAPMEPIGEAQDPQVGQVAYVQAQCDVNLCTPNDLAQKFDLSESQSGLSPTFFTTPDQFYKQAGGVVTNIATPTTLTGVQSFGYTSDSIASFFPRGSGPYSCSECMIWPIASLTQSDPYADGGNLIAGTSMLGLVQYAPNAPATLLSSEDPTNDPEAAARVGSIISFPITVDPAPITDEAQAAISSTGSLNVLAAARWPGLAPIVQASPASIWEEVYLTDTLNGNPVNIEVGYCNYEGWCAPTRSDGSDFPSPTPVAANGALDLSIDLTSLPSASSSQPNWVADLRSGAAKVDVVFTAPWSQSDSKVTQALSTAIPATIGKTANFASAVSTYQGAVMQNPDLSPPGGAFTWSMYDGEMSFFTSLFGDSAAKVLTDITNQILVTIITTVAAGPFGDAMAAIGEVADAVGASIAKFAGSVLSKIAMRARAYLGSLHVSEAAIESVDEGFATFTTVGTDLDTGVTVETVSLDTPVVKGSWFSNFKTGAASLISKGVAKAGKAFIGKLVSNLIGVDSVTNYAQLYMHFTCGGAPSGPSFNAPKGAAMTLLLTDVVKKPALWLIRNKQVIFDWAPRVRTTDNSFNDSSSLQATFTSLQNEVDADPQSQQLVAWEKSLQADMATAASPSANDPNDEGYGYGLADQFTQYFTTIVSAGVTESSVAQAQQDGVKVEVDLMSNPHSYNAVLGQDPNYRVLEPLATCDLHGVCTGDEPKLKDSSVTVSAIAGTMVISGTFPQDVAWTPPGAWLRIQVLSYPNGASTPKVLSTSYDDVPFMGNSLPCPTAIQVNDPGANGTESTPFSNWNKAWEENNIWGACQVLSEAMHHANLKWTETEAWGYSPLNHGGIAWQYQASQNFTQPLPSPDSAMPNQYGLTGGLPF